MDALNDIVLIALIIAAIITIIFGTVVSKEIGDWIEGIAILVAVAIVSGVGSVQNYSQEKQFQSLAKVKEDRNVLVIRDGAEKSVSIYDVVVGDIYVIKTGEILPVDGLFLSGNGIKCDESAMTGESFEINKSIEAPFFFGGSQVTAGAGSMLVLTTGLDTTYGQIVKALEIMDPSPTPLQEKLEKMATQIGYFGLGGGLLIFIVLTCTYLGRFHPDYPDAFESILSFFIIGITIIVVAVPEGLPLAVTLTLVYSMKKMIKDHVLVRELNACETMGSATTICSDKTGTLTENRMTVVKGYFYGHLYDTLPTLQDIGGTTHRDLLARAIALNSDASVNYIMSDKATSGVEVETIEFEGNKTEGGLLHMLRAAFNLNYDYIRATGGNFVYRENFNSATKRMCTIYSPDSPATSNAQLKTIEEGGILSSDPNARAQAATSSGFRGSGKYVVYSKGASEMILAECTKLMKADGTVKAIDEVERAQLLTMIEALASRGLRTLGIAYRHLEPSEVPAGAESQSQSVREGAWEAAVAENKVETKLTLLAIAAIKDPVRAAVPHAVAQCKSAGIKVRMVTGDNLLTARFIAEECGIYTGGLYMEGKEWREMTDEQRADCVMNLEVLARAIPSDKLLLVNTLKEMGQTVAVTGDGTNDAPALKAAHIGCAMGIAGTEVAKEAGKMIIMDDNFASIVVAVIWGRSVLENIRKFLVFQLTINLVAGLLTFIMACYHKGEVAEFPLSAIQLLWINLLMDSFAALMLATEPPDPELMRMKPQDKTMPLLSKTMIKYVVVHSVYQVAMLLWMTLSTAGTKLFLLPDWEMGHRHHYTCIFNTFVWFQLFNLFNARRIHDQYDLLKNFSKSALAHCMIGLIIVLQIILVELGGDAFRTTGLNVEQWFICIAIGATSIPIGYLCRIIPYRDDIMFHKDNTDDKASALDKSAGLVEAEATSSSLISVPTKDASYELSSNVNVKVVSPAPSPIV